MVALDIIHDLGYGGISDRPCGIADNLAHLLILRLMHKNVGVLRPLDCIGPFPRVAADHDRAPLVIEAIADGGPDRQVIDLEGRHFKAASSMIVSAKVADVAQQILDYDPKNLRALAILTTLERANFNGGDAAALAPMGDHAAKGLALLPGWTQPPGMADDVYKTLRDTMTVAFEGAHGFALLQTKDYEGARKAYLKALAIDPSNIEDVYQLGVTELQTKPVRVGAFWWLARAYDLAGAQHADAVQKAIGDYAKGKYVAYHGSDDGWDAIVAGAADKPKPPDDFAVSAAAKK